MTNVAESGIINTSSTNQTKYYYDSLSQLVREDNPYANKTYTYEYDGNGNITSKKTYSYTTGTLGSVEDTVTYSYGNSDWKDLLTSHDGTTISYDASGNPLNWTDYREMTWEGRQLDSIMSPDGARWAFKYDHNGLRTEREYSYSGEIVLKTEYTWVDEKLVKEYRSGGMNTTPITLEYFYNGEDLIGFSIQEGDAAAVNYYYGKTNNGEIRFIYDSNGNIVTTYLYDAWGNPIPTDESSDSEVGEINPFRYKSYYYDSETRLYYLRSRSYDPVVGRFLNADSTDYLGTLDQFVATNLFVYGLNNPIKNSDIKGTSSVRLIGFGLQLEMDIGVYTYGLELIWYVDATVRSGRSAYIPYLYFYGNVWGKTVDLTSYISKITKNPSLLLKPKMLAKGSISICAFLVFGYNNFNDPDDYCGVFVGTSLTVWNIKAFYAVGDTCFSVGGGVSTSKFSASYGMTYYISINKILPYVNSLYSVIRNMANSYRNRA